jgi:hypothetical protein
MPQFQSSRAALMYGHLRPGDMGRNRRSAGRATWDGRPLEYVELSERVTRAASAVDMGALDCHFGGQRKCSASTRLAGPTSLSASVPPSPTGFTEALPGVTRAFVNSGSDDGLRDATEQPGGLLRAECQESPLGLNERVVRVGRQAD